MKLLVTGSKGQVARCLAQRASEKGVNVANFSRPVFDFAKTDKLRAGIRETLGREEPSVLVNLAAYTAVDEAEREVELARRINADAPGILAAAAHEADIPIIHMSTDYVFDGSLDRPYQEEDPVAPLGVYGVTKEKGERAVREAAPQHAILRTAWVYSPFGKNFVKTMLRLSETTEVVRVVNDERGNPTNAFDLADIILSTAAKWAEDKASSRPFTGIANTYHVAGCRHATWADFARAIYMESDRLGGPVSIVQGIPSEEYRSDAERPKNSTLHCAKFENTFGISMRGLKPGLTNVIQSLLKKPTRANV